MTAMQNLFIMSHCLCNEGYRCPFQLSPKV